jgi:REP-associated tyrosine transposase
VACSRRASTVALVKHEFWLLAFVYMPEHVHVLVFPTSPVARIERLLFAIKRPFSYRAEQYLDYHNPALLHRLTISERPGKTVFRFWQEGPGYDRNLTSGAALPSVIDYIHNNPVWRGLSVTPGQWRRSSWGYYHQSREVRDPELPVVRGVQDLLRKDGEHGQASRPWHPACVSSLRA